MTLASLENLLSPTGQEAIAAASALQPLDESYLQAFEKLRKKFDPDLAKSALETAILRSKAAGKFPQAASLYFEREALEQATHHVVAEHRAQRFSQFKTVLDLGCGIGADSIALANAGCRVVAVENDPLRARLAELNFKTLGLTIPVLNVDALTADLPVCDAVFCDPARRTGERRHLNTDQYSPSPKAILDRFPDRPVGFKLAPGIAWNDLNQFEDEVEFVSLNRELKECRLWCGGLATAERRATVLPAGATLTGHRDQAMREIAEPGQFLFVPGAAVVRARLEPVLAELLQARFPDPEHPLLTGSTTVDSPFAVRYAFETLVTGSVAKLNEALRHRAIGRVTFLNFGSPRDVETVRRGLKLRGSEHRTVLLTRLSGAAAALILQAAEKP